MPISPDDFWKMVQDPSQIRAIAERMADKAEPPDLDPVELEALVGAQQGGPEVGGLGGEVPIGAPQVRPGGEPLSVGSDRGGAPGVQEDTQSKLMQALVGAGGLTQQAQRQQPGQGVPARDCRHQASR